MNLNDIRLTETVLKGGCAAKLPAGKLKEVLQNLKLKKPAELLIGTETMDDACLWALDSERSLVQTLDFFTPIVDDPRSFGAIAAANALSDVYAMGGEPCLALTILAFPVAKLPLELLQPLMEGAIERIEAAGACLAGGHSIDDDTLKLGFSVTGFVPKKGVWSNAGAKPGDALILTKGLGTGTLASAIKSKRAESSWIESAIASMTTLNKVRDLLGDIEVHAATDITGFGLAGHALQMCRASAVQAKFNLKRVPIIEGALACLEEGILNKAHHSNASYVADATSYEGSSDAWRGLTVDPQTSGGLLLAVDDRESDSLLSRIRSRFPLAAKVGFISEGRPHLTFEG